MSNRGKLEKAFTRLFSKLYIV